MKIIYKHGSTGPACTKAYKIACASCGCGFYATHHEFTWSEKSINGRAGITCPECNVEIVFRPCDCMVDVHEDIDCTVFAEAQAKAIEQTKQETPIDVESAAVNSTGHREKIKEVEK